MTLIGTNLSGPYLSWAARMMQKPGKTNEVWNKLFLFENENAQSPIDRVPLLVPMSIGRKFFMGLNINMIPGPENKKKLLVQLVKLEGSTSNSKIFTNNVAKALRPVTDQFGNLGMVNTYKISNKTIRQGRWATVSYQEALDHYDGY